MINSRYLFFTKDKIIIVLIIHIVPIHCSIPKDSFNHTAARNAADNGSEFNKSINYIINFLYITRNTNIKHICSLNL